MRVLHTKFGIAKLNCGYFRIFSSKEGNLNKPLHRLIYEDFWGVKLPSEIIVHHKDGNKLNNCILNLEAMYRSDHSKLHMKNNEHMLGKSHTEETKKKQSISKQGIPRQELFKKQLSLQKNNTGYFRVSKRKRNNDQGFSWRYRVHELGKEVVFESKNLNTLKSKVIENGYEWVKLSEVNDEIND